VRLAASSCAFNAFMPTVLGEAGLRDDLDAFIFMGDTTYNDGDQNLRDFRISWQGNFRKNFFRRLKAQTPILATWDDHEITNNWNPETVSQDLLAEGTQAYFENLPLRPNTENPGRLWKKLSWGQTVEVYVLDCRSERLPSTRDTDDPIFISREQMDWLKENLSESTAHFKLLLSSVPISDFGSGFDGSSDDRWQGYAGQRTEILSHIEDNSIPGVVWLAGDVHFPAIGRPSREGPGSQSLEVIAGPIAQLRNPASNLLDREQYDWASTGNNYVDLYFIPATNTLEVTYFNNRGEVMFEGSYNP